MTRKKISNVFSLLFFLFAFLSLQAQTAVKVNYYDGSTQNFDVQEAGKLYFNNSNLMINTNGTNTTTIPVNIIQSIVFEGEMGTVDVDVSEKLILYPNPSTDFFKIVSDSKEKVDVQIFNMSGQQLLQGKYLPNSSIDIRTFAPGIYIVKINDKSNLKLIKK